MIRSEPDRLELLVDNEGSVVARMDVSLDWRGCCLDLPMFDALISYLICPG